MVVHNDDDLFGDMLKELKNTGNTPTESTPPSSTPPSPQNTAADDDETDEGEGEDTDPVSGYKREKRPARLDITKNSKEDHCFPQRCTRKEAEDQLKKDYLYMKRMVIMPFTIMDEYPFKKKESDSDIPDEKGKNVDKGTILVFGRQTKWKGIIRDEYNGLPYIIGEALYIKRGVYDIGELRPHFALVIKKQVKKIKKTVVRDLFDPIKNELQTGIPFVVYDEFPKIIREL